jgi:hypothetical protein
MRLTFGFILTTALGLVHYANADGCQQNGPFDFVCIHTHTSSAESVRGASAYRMV